MAATAVKFGAVRPRLPPFLETIHPAKGGKSAVTQSKAANIPNIIQQTNAQLVQKPKTFEEIFDDLMEKAQVDPVATLIEVSFQPVFDSTHTILWIYLPNQDIFFSPSFALAAPSQRNLISYCFKSRTMICCDTQKSHQSFNPKVDGRIISAHQPVLLIPILSRENKGVAVLEFARKVEKVFVTHEKQIATFLMNKFKIYSRLLFSDVAVLDIAQYMVHSGERDVVVKLILNNLAHLFKSRKAEIYMKDYEQNIVLKYHDCSTTPQEMNCENLGTVGYALDHLFVVREKSVRDHPSYNALVDGYFDENIIIVPAAEDTTRRWAILLKGRSVPAYYSIQDEVSLNKIIPFVVNSIETSIGGDDLPDDSQKRLAALLEVAEALSGVLDLEQLIPLIMDRSTTLLNAERCSLFLVDKVNKQLVTRFHGGLAKAIRLPIGKGIVGTAATTGQVINITDAYQDPRFDPTTDKKTGFNTKAILAIPIFDNRGEIAGVTEMINRKDGGSFDEDDVKLLMGFNVFCGISLDNAKLYNASLDLARQLRSFVDMSSNYKHANSIRTQLEQIICTGRNIISAERGTIYYYDQKTQNIELLASVGGNSQYGTAFAKEVIDKKESTIFNREDILAISNQGMDINSAIDRILNNPSALNSLAQQSGTDSTRTSRVMKALNKENDEGDEENQDAIVAIPLFDSDKKTIGAIEYFSTHKMITEDLRLLDSVSVFASVLIESSKLKDIAELGEQEQEVQQYISADERERCDQVPLKLLLSQEKLDHIWTNNFDSPQWDGIGHIQVLFAIFDRFKILKSYKISNEKFFRFISEIRDTYKKVPYHNWRHAVDVTQFVTYQILTAKLDTKLTKFELFALLVSCICHDANHDGFTNVFNEKAETPLGILFKNQSVMETHHCSVTIGIISKAECNLFEHLSSDEFRVMWTTVISLILATDMAKHFQILKQYNELEDNKEFNLEKQENRMLLMQLVLKCGDISNVSRPFDLADKWCDVLCDEFFRQGDLEMAHGMEYTSPLNDRAHLDKPKSQIGFYTFVCLPLFQAAARSLKPLECNVNQVKSNLAVWKAAAEARAALEAAEAAEAAKEAESTDSK